MQTLTFKAEPHEPTGLVEVTVWAGTERSHPGPFAGDLILKAAAWEALCSVLVAGDRDRNVVTIDAEALV